MEQCLTQLGLSQFFYRVSEFGVDFIKAFVGIFPFAHHQYNYDAGLWK